MRVEQRKWSDEQWISQYSTFSDNDQPALVLVFASPNQIHNEVALQEIRTCYPHAIIAGGSTAGNVCGVSSADNDIVSTAISLDHGTVRLISLQHVLVLSDGLNINGSDLADGLSTVLDVPVTGGLMGDNASFERTWVIADGAPASNQIAFIGLYGENLSVTNGCYAGWDEFGIKRVITRSIGNVVYEIDDQPALTLYKNYLGEYANEMPSSGLRFPLSIRDSEGNMLIRTLLAVDEEAQSLTFAGDVPEGSITLLMKGNTENLIAGAATAATQAVPPKDNDGLAIVISCVGRRMLMDQMADEELEVINEVCGNKVRLAGFYSYGELSPHENGTGKCSLHNQTMTMIMISEAANGPSS